MQGKVVSGLWLDTVEKMTLSSITWLKFRGSIISFTGSFTEMMNQPNTLVNTDWWTGNTPFMSRDLMRMIFLLRLPRSSTAFPLTLSASPFLILTHYWKRLLHIHYRGKQHRWMSRMKHGN